MRYRQYMYLGGSGDHSRVRPASAPYGMHSIFGTLVAGVEENVRVKFQVSRCNGRAVTEDSVGSRTRSRTLLYILPPAYPRPLRLPVFGHLREAVLEIIRGSALPRRRMASTPYLARR